MKSSKIEIEVALKEDNSPQQIMWNADDDPQGKGTKEAQAMFVSFFDKQTKETLKIDLWTDDFQIQEMDRMMFQTIRALTDTYYKATKNAKLAGAMQQFTQYFGEETGIIPKSDS